MKVIDDKKYMTPLQVSSYFSIPVSTVRTWIHRGKILTHTIGRMHFIPVSEVERVEVLLGGENYHPFSKKKKGGWVKREVNVTGEVTEESELEIEMLKKEIKKLQERLQGGRSCVKS